MKIAVMKEYNISDERIKDLLCAAFEGGSNYWIANAIRDMAKGADAEFLHEVPFVNGCQVKIWEIDLEEDPPKLLGRTQIEKGLQVMAEKYAWHFDNFINENEDAETGDVFLQCCVFGELVYG